MSKTTGYIVRSAINPALVLCTDGEFRAEIQVGPGGYAAKIYKSVPAAQRVRGGFGITVEKYADR
jgi:hypothetical protein